MITTGTDIATDKKILFIAFMAILLKPGESNPGLNRLRLALPFQDPDVLRMAKLLVSAH
jgi:hypothetical protein